MSLMFLGLLLGIHATEIEDRYGNGQYSESKFFEGTLDLLQGAMEDIQYAYEDLEVMEQQLATLATKKDLFKQTMDLLTDAVDRDNFINDFNHDNVEVN